MVETFQERLSELLREIEIDVGSTNMSLWVLEALESAVKDLHCKNLHKFFEELMELTEYINNTEPKFAILIDAFYDILHLAYDEELLHPRKNFPLKKRKFTKLMEDIIHEHRREQKAIIENAMSIKVEGKGILVHDNSRTVQRVLNAFQRAGKHFTVIVAEQDPDKTGPVIEALHRNEIPFRVVPSYMITHLEDHIDLVFLGGVTLKSTMDFVMDPGTNALVSQFHFLKKPIYVFMATGKFSLWHSKKRTEIYSHVHRRKHHCKAIDFERVKFSHDRVELARVKKLVTEEGIFTPRQIENFFKEKLKKRLKSGEAFRRELDKMKRP